MGRDSGLLEGVPSLGLNVRMGVPGSRLLKETQQSFSSASVSGGPGGQAQVSFSGSEGTFSQTFNGAGSLQFSTENGGTLTVQDAAGVPQTFTSVLGPAGAPLPPPTVNPASLPTVESISRSIPTLNLPGTNDDFAAQVRAQIQAFFNQYYRSFKPPGAIAGPAAGAAVGAIVAQPSTVVPRAAVAAAPQGPVITQQNTGSGQRVSFCPIVVHQELPLATFFSFSHTSKKFCSKVEIYLISHMSDIQTNHVVDYFPGLRVLLATLLRTP